MYLRTSLTSILLSGVLLAGGFTTSSGEDYAFLVAVQEYDVKQLRPLHYARNDILEFHKTLLSSGYGPKNVVLMHDDLRTLGQLRFAPEANKIRHELKLLLSTLDTDDSVIVAFLNG